MEIPCDQKSNSKGQAWFCTIGLPSDVVIEVDDMSFHLHKFPLMSKSRKLHDLIKAKEQNPSSGAGDVSGDGDEDEIEEMDFHVALSDFPGGSEAFESAAKFCYGVKIDLTAANVAALRCAGEFLEMTEEYSEENLISKTERFMSETVVKSLKESVRALKSCERVMAMAEGLGIVQRCVDAVADRAAAADPTLFGWPVHDGGGGGESARKILWNGIDAGRRKKTLARGQNSDSWLDELAQLSLPLFKRLITAMKGRDLSSEMIENCLIHYAKKRIPGISRSNRKPPSSSSIVSESEQRELLESVISNLPPERTSSSGAVAGATRFLFGLLRTANILGVSASNKSFLEKKLGTQLDQASLDDLLIPSYSYLNETLYDVDCVERILSHFLEYISEDRNRNPNAIEGSGSPWLMVIGKLIDGYLSEIASDSNLKAERFFSLAMALPDQARVFHDGLYRAVDVYLKAHPTISESDREKICGVLDCQKLTLEACTHAAQNERLPLRAVVQVLFFEQLQLRHAIAENLIAVEAAQTDAPRPSALLPRDTTIDDEDDDDADPSPDDRPGDTWRNAVRENQVLRLDMDSMRTRVHQLERECSTMRKVIEKFDSPVTQKGTPECSEHSRSWRGSLNKRFGCKFKTQVCDSQQPSSVVETRNGRRQNRHRRQQS